MQIGNEELIDTDDIATNDVHQYLTFFIAGEEYGINILDVQEIKGWEGVTLIPNMPEHILGVINLRGTVVPILDLRQCFGIESIEFGVMTVVIMVKVFSDGDERVVGVVADAVAEVYNVSGEMIEPPPSMNTIVDSEYINGLTTIQDKMVILLDISKLIMEEALDDDARHFH